jgi:UDP-glucose 4-epimerase
MRALVTGGAGYIGSHAALRLLDEGHDVTVVDNLVRGHRGAIEVLQGVGGTRFTFVEADLAHTEALARAMELGRIDTVLHFAALTYVGESVDKPLDYFTANTAGGISLLRAMQQARVRRIVFSSTCATYGEPPQEEIPLRETLAQRPINPYGASKLLFERVLRDTCAAPAAEGAPPLAAVALRYFNVAGCDARGRLGEDHRPETHLIPIALEVALGKRGQLSVFGTDYATRDGTCIRDYVHIDDLIDAHLAALPALAHGAFHAWNVGIGRGYSVREVIESCRRVTGHAIPTVDAPRRAGDPPMLYADPTAIARDLGWRAQRTDLDETVRSAWRWMQAHPRGYA